MNTAQKFNFTKEQLAEMKAALQAYFLEELELEIGDLQAELFTQFLNDQIGTQYYNLGLTDAIKKIKENADDLVMLAKD